MSAAAIHHLSSPATPIAPETPQPLADAVRQISTITAPFETAGLTPVQVRIAAALAAGTTIVRAALDAGVHRTTIHKWLQTSKEFCDAVKQARDHYDGLIADQLNELSVLALDTIRQLLTNPDTPPAVRLRAALAVLGRPNPSGDPDWHRPKSCGIIAVAPPRPPLGHEEFMKEMTARNAPCPCGSGLKYKRCCGSPGHAVAAAA